MVQRMILVALLAAGLVGVLWWSQQSTEPLKVSGFIEADEIRIGSRVGGRVRAVHVVEGQAVVAGDVLIELEPFDLLERRAEGQARFESLRAMLAKLEAGPRKQEIVASRSQLDLAGAQLNLTKITLERVKKAFDASAATREELDRRTEELNVAQAAVAVREAELALLEEGTRTEEIAEARASLDAAKASLSAIDRQIEELAIRAPAGSGAVVESIDLQPGDLVSANAPVMSLIDSGVMWVRAYVPENRMSFSMNQKVDIAVDSFPGKTFSGHVAFVARDAEFTPGNVQTPEERSKQVFRIKVVLDEGLDQLRAGMAADVWLEPRP